MAANLAAAEAVIRAVLQHQHAYLFDAPVDPVLLGIPTYFDVIKAPMDLGTVLTRLQRKQYSSAGEVLRDANLVWHNCLTFNPPGDPVSAACCEVRQRFNELWRDAALPLTPAPPGPVLPPRGGAAAAAAPPPPRVDKKRKAAPPPPPPPLAGGDPAAYEVADEDGAGGAAGGSATRCAVCASQRRGKCGTPTAPARCERRTPGMPVAAPPKRGAAPAPPPQRASARPHASVEAPPPPPSAEAVAARSKAVGGLAAAQEALHEAAARLATALAAEGAARDAVRGMRPHDAPQPPLAPPGWAQRAPRVTPQAHALASFFWGLRSAQPPARAA